MNGKNIFSEKEGALESQLIKTVGQTRTSPRRPRILSDFLQEHREGFTS